MTARADRSICLSPPVRSAITSAWALLSSLPKVNCLLGNRGYGADGFRAAFKDNWTCACIPGRKQRKTPVKHDKRRYKRRSHSLSVIAGNYLRAVTEIMFGRLKGWPCVATRYDPLQRCHASPVGNGCPKIFLSVTALAAIVIYWQ